MTEYKMLWITDNPISAVGKNTIRKLRNYYDRMVPGDTVVLTVASDVDLSVIHMVEHLIVKSIAKGDGGDIINMFASNNISNVSITELKIILSNLYGDVIDQQFMSITFH